MTGQHFISLFHTDLRNIMRDRSPLSVAVAPVVLLLLLHLILPRLTEAVTALNTFIPLIIACTCLIIALFPAYILSFAMIDEKDQHILQVIRIMPISSALFILYRLTLGGIVAFIFCFLVLYTTEALSMMLSIAVAVAFACITPLTQMLIVSRAGNKIEGVAMFKFVNMFWLLPLIGVVGGWEGRYVLGIIPTFWLFEWFAQSDVLLWSPALYVVLILLYSIPLFQRLRTVFR